ncbi:carbohydrate ABC transporter permease [Halobacillus halophilus]|uniref:ABC-type transport system permease protein (Probable substrate sugar/lactose/L-arabinose) n=2 Tax=Halobacillus TaxID=45667 RepID=I0JRV4_HALH3|nr:carbohydrate ABC transporter permease [Halobacillus halophilus]ASF40827.1 carbohydrate ABC transporter permease [Halobacillus halophilus]MCA1010828.1 carbohydrate ABC transporter permease [Halobacillus halophilus]CCG46875.1 ABC-type transport system permease protein (probable substrate sugar/lactose/L-arabinose) [Halobacillus halophilus DSM 2266]
MKNVSPLKKTLLYFFLFVGVIVSVFPFYWMFVGATNPSGEIFKVPPNFFPGTHGWENFKNLNENVGIIRVLGNSLLITLTFTALAAIICTAAGYAFAKFQFKGRNQIFFMLLVAIMIPYHVTLIPLFEIFSNVGWLNTFQAVILPQAAYPFAIFLMRQNMQAIPDSLLEAARVDGAGEFHIFFRIVLPVMRPALAAVGIFLFMFQWNNFIWPLVVLQSQDMYTLPVALSSLVGMSRIDYGQVMMGTTLSTLPIMIFFLLLQKQFISGILGGSVKE